MPLVVDADAGRERELPDAGKEEPGGSDAQTALDVHQTLAHARRELLRFVDVVPADVLPQDPLDVALFPLGDLPVLGDLDASGADSFEGRADDAEYRHHSQEEEAGLGKFVDGDVEKVAEDHDDEALRRAEGQLEHAARDDERLVGRVGKVVERRQLAARRRGGGGGRDGGWHALGGHLQPRRRGHFRGALRGPQRQLVRR